MPLISVVIPVFNERENIRPLYQKLKKVLGGLKDYKYEILFVDDGSIDGTEEEIKKIKDSQVKAIIFRRNFGKSAALSAGFRFARGDLIFTLDGDLQDEPAEIPHFLEKIKEGYDLVSGWKKERKDPFNKRFFSKIFNKVISHSSGLKIHDFNCGFKLYKKELVRELDIYGELHRFIPALAHLQGYKVGEIPVRHNPRIYGQSKYGAKRILKGLFDFWTVLFLKRFMFSPMYFFGSVGSVCFIIGLLINIYLSIEKIFFHQHLSNRPLLLLGILLMILGIQFVSIGFLGELQVSLSKRKAPYSIKEIIQHQQDDSR